MGPSSGQHGTITEQHGTISEQQRTIRPLSSMDGSQHHMLLSTPGGIWSTPVHHTAAPVAVRGCWSTVHTSAPLALIGC